MEKHLHILLSALIFFLLIGCQAELPKEDVPDHGKDKHLHFKEQADSSVYVLFQAGIDDYLKIIDDLSLKNSEKRISDFRGHDQKVYILIRHFSSFYQAESFIDKTLKITPSYQGYMIIPISKYNFRLLLSDLSRFDEYKTFYSDETSK